MTAEWTDATHCEPLAPLHVVCKLHDNPLCPHSAVFRAAISMHDVANTTQGDETTTASILMQLQQRERDLGGKGGAQKVQTPIGCGRG